jgi:hypothetical protein
MNGMPKFARRILSHPNASSLEALSMEKNRRWNYNQSCQGQPHRGLTLADLSALANWWQHIIFQI